MIISTNQQEELIPWKPKHILYVIVGGAIMNIACYLILKELIRISPEATQFFKDGKGTGVTMFISYIIQLISFLLPIYFIGKKIIKTTWQEVLGFHPVSGKTILFSVFLAQCTSLFVFGMLTFAMWLSHTKEIPGFSGGQEPLGSFFGTSGESYLFAFLSVSILAPLVEELFFRGMIQSTIEKYLPAISGIILSSAIFSLSHFQFQVALPLFIMGLILGTLFKKTGSLIPGIIFHGINNSLYILLEIWK